MLFLFALLSSGFIVNGARVEPIPAAELLPYPPMHWHSWNLFCAENEVNINNMKEIAGLTCP